MTVSDSTNITAPRVPFLDEAGLISRPWFMWLLNMFARANTSGSDITGLTADVATLNTGVATLNTEVATLNTEVATLNTEVATLDTEITLTPKQVFFAGATGKPAGSALLQFDLAGNQLVVGTTVDIGDFIQLTEETAPAAPAINKVRIYAQDNGAGKTQLMAKFATGAAQQLAIQP